MVSLHRVLFCRCFSGQRNTSLRARDFGRLFSEPVRAPAREGAFVPARQCAVGAWEPGRGVCAVPRREGVQGECLGPFGVFRRHRVHQHFAVAGVWGEDALTNGFVK
jgi:hypothetical protein